MKLRYGSLAGCVLLLAATAGAASYEGTQCGGLEKWVNLPQLQGLPLHKLVCLQNDQAKAQKLHLPVFRTLDLHYGSAGGPLASLRVGYGTSADMGAAMMSGSGQRLRDMHALLKQNAAGGDPGMVKILKDWEAGNREVDWGKTQNAFVTFQDGVANAGGVIKGGQNLYFMINFPSSNIDTAASTAQQIFNRVRVDPIIAGQQLAPLGVIGEQDQNGIRHPGD